MSVSPAIKNLVKEVTDLTRAYETGELSRSEMEERSTRVLEAVLQVEVEIEERPVAPSAEGRDE